MTVGSASATADGGYDVSRDERIRPRVVAVVPAYNEAQNIAVTLASLHRQSHPAKLIVVICDNCTDDTEFIAAREGALALVTVENTAGKAGAIHQALECLLYTTLVQPADLVLVVDADAELGEDFVAEAVASVERGDAGVYVNGRDTAGRREALALTGPAILFNAADLQGIIEVRRRRVRPGGSTASGTTALTEGVERRRAGACAGTLVLAASRSVTLVPAPARAMILPAGVTFAPSDMDLEPGRGVAIVVPACNEAEQIASTLSALVGQSVTPCRIVVVANNCIDATVDISREFAEQSELPVRVEVVTMANNRHRKAGALNHGLSHLVAQSPDDGLVGVARYVVTIDADTILDRDFIQRAVRILDADPQLGGLSAACRAKAGLGETPWQRLLTLFQRIEYGRYATTRIRTNVHTMSGAGSVYRSSILDAQRQSYGYVFAPTSMVEDFTLTLDIKGAGWNVTTNQHCVAYTDLMLTLRSLQAQRVRWCRGTINELRSRGWTRDTAQSIGMVLLGLLGTLYLALWSIFTVAGIAAHGFRPDVTTALWMVFWSGYQIVAARDLGWRIMVFEAVLVPGLIFGLARNYWLFRSIATSYGRSASARVCRVLRITPRPVTENWS